MNKVVDIFTGLIVVAAIFVMVRPGSKGPQLVKAIGSSFGWMLWSATGRKAW